MIDRGHEHVDAARIVARAGARAEAVVETERVVARELRDGADAERPEVAERGGADVGEVGEAKGAGGADGLRRGSTRGRGGWPGGTLARHGGRLRGADALHRRPSEGLEACRKAHRGERFLELTCCYAVLTVYDSMAMVKTLTKHGNSYALVIDRAILELLHIDPERPVELTTDGNALTIRPMTEGTKGARVARSLKRVNEKHGKALKRLGE